MEHVVESQQFDKKIIKRIFSIADSLNHRTGHSLRGKIMATLFYEPSTRTRFSFESAMLRLGGGVISTENAKEFSSAAKGETLEDTIRIVNQYADVIVLRHPENGAAARAAGVSTVPLINAGDGSGQHPTQALLDLYTIYKEFGTADGLRVTMVGDLKNGRTVRSLSYLLGKYHPAKITFVSPKELAIGQDIKDYLHKHSVAFDERRQLEQILANSDVIYQTRIQKERFKNLSDYRKHKGRYVLDLPQARAMKAHSIIMHPLPRVDEIAPEVDASPKAVYFKQARYGLLVRMALLKFLLA